MGFLKNVWSLIKSVFSGASKGFSSSVTGDESPILNFVKGASGSGLTSAQIQANDFSASEAQKNRDWQTMMSNTAYQRQVEDMKAAGLNPMSMYGGNLGSGASTPSGSAPSSVSPEIAGGLLDTLLNVAFASERMNQLRAQTKNIEANTQKTETEIDYQNLVNKYYPDVTEKQLSKMDTEIGNLFSQMDLNLSEKSKVDIESGLLQSQKVMQDLQNSTFMEKFNVELQKIKNESGEIDQRRLKELAETTLSQATKDFLDKYGFLPGPNQWLGLGVGLSEMFQKSGLEIQSPMEWLIDSSKNVLKRWKNAYEKFYNYNKLRRPADRYPMPNVTDSLKIRFKDLVR